MSICWPKCEKPRDDRPKSRRCLIGACPLPVLPRRQPLHEDGSCSSRTTGAPSMMMLESLIRRVPECPSALCLETLGRARRGKVAVRFSVAASVRFPGAGVGVGVGDGEGFGLRHGGVLGEFGGEGAANEVYASSPSRPACALSRPTAYSCFDELNGTMVPDGSLRQSDCPVELSSLR